MNAAVAERAPSQAIVLREQSAPSMTEIVQMASAVAKSGLFGIKTQDQAIALMLIAQAEGLHPAIAARDYDIIQGRPSKKSEAMMRSFIANGGKVKWHKLDDAIADATFSHPAGGEVRISWDLTRAATAGLKGKDMYAKYPRQMLRARCISEGVRTVCPMATSGMYVPEEVVDMEPEQPQTQSTLMPRPKSGTTHSTPADSGQSHGPAATPDAPAAAEPSSAGAAESQPSSNGSDKQASPGQIKMIRAKLAGAPIDEATLLAAIGASTVDGLTITQGNAALKHLQSL